MKKVLLFLLVVVFVSGFVSAGVCSPGDADNILNLFQPTNSHGELWNGGVYTNTICYSDIYGVAYSGPSPNICTGSNRLFYLSDTTNSQASAAGGPLYPEEVCYGDLECTVSASCVGDEQEIVRLFDTDNTHISEVGDLSYPNVVCCTSPSVIGGSGSNVWRNIHDGGIFSANVGDTVMMYDGDHNISGFLNDGDPVIFEIIELDSLVINNDDIRVGVNAIVGYYNSTENAAIGYWTITQDDFDAADGTEWDNYVFYTSGDSFSLESNDLKLLDDGGGNPLPDDDPTALKFVTPICGDYFDEGASVDIDISAFDSDDIISGTLTVIDGIGDSTPDFTFGNGFNTFNYDFLTSGNFRLLINSVNSRGKTTRNSSGIMLIDTSQDGDYLAACITEPGDSMTFNSSIVTFNARNSTGIEFIFPGTYNPLDYDEFTYGWKFYNLATGNYEANPISDGMNPLASYFEIAFAEVGDKRAELSLSYP